MKIVTTVQMTALETEAYHHGFEETLFMEKAGHGVALSVQDYVIAHGLEKKSWVLCGKGNNGGDAFVAAFYLLEAGFEVCVIQPEEAGERSLLNQQNRERFLNAGGEIKQTILRFDSKGIIVDGFLGTGFKGVVREPLASIIDLANQSGLPILSIDIPSGLNGTTGDCGDHVIHATETLFLELPKLGFFLKEGWNVAGRLKKINFGLPLQMIEQISTTYEWISPSIAAQFLPVIKRNRHKYQAGHVVGFAGSSSMPGAALLASLSALRGGSGIVHLLHPKGIENLLVTSPYEVIKIPVALDNPSFAIEWLNKGGGAFFGPGIGRTSEVHSFISGVMPDLRIPVVIDADALFAWTVAPFSFPKETILTPHHGEMQLLLNQSEPFDLTAESLQKCRNFSDRYQVTLILKGAPTFIFHPGDPVYVSTVGDPGMASAGTGDVLTGLLAALLSQKLGTKEAAILGVFLHGLSGELAVKKRKTSYGMIASDLIGSFPEAFSELEVINLDFGFISF